MDRPKIPPLSLTKMQHIGYTLFTTDPEAWIRRLKEIQAHEKTGTKNHYRNSEILNQYWMTPVTVRELGEKYKLTANRIRQLTRLYLLYIYRLHQGKFPYNTGGPGTRVNDMD